MPMTSSLGGSLGASATTGRDLGAMASEGFRLAKVANSAQSEAMGVESSTLSELGDMLAKFRAERVSGVFGRRERGSHLPTT